MSRYTATQLSRALGAIVDEALGGEEIEVTRHGHIAARLTTDIPEGARVISITEFLAKVGTWLDVVENEGQPLALTRRDRAVVALVPHIPGYVKGDED